MGRYIVDQDVTLRLLGKVKFTDDPNQENYFQNTLLRDLIAQAEAQVEYDLSPRYASPFQTDDGAPYKAFSTIAKTDQRIYVAINAIKQLCQLQAVIMVLSTDFGRGSVVEADKYIERLEKKYQNTVNSRILAKKKIDGSETNQWSYPPMPLLKLNYMNTEADDGYMGQVLSTNQVSPQYPQFQINDPSENFWNGILDDPFIDPGNGGSGG